MRKLATFLVLTMLILSLGCSNYEGPQLETDPDKFYTNESEEITFIVKSVQLSGGYKTFWYAEILLYNEEYDLEYPYIDSNLGLLGPPRIASLKEGDTLRTRIFYKFYPSSGRKEIYKVDPNFLISYYSDYNNNFSKNQVKAN